jgi:plastocyanin
MTASVSTMLGAYSGAFSDAALEKAKTALRYDAATLRWARLVFLLFLGVSVSRADQTVNVGPGIAFSPSSVTIAPGEKIIWIWMGSPHSSTSNASSGPEVWDSGVLSTGATFSHTFTNPGTYPYYCVVHSSPTGTAMNGVVQVVPSTPTPTPPPATPTPSLATPTPPPGNPASIPDAGRAGRAALAMAILAVGLRLLARRGEA